MQKVGRVTIPGQEGMDEEIKELVKKWGADAIRNSDGTELPESLTQLTDKVYATYKLCRNDQEWAKAHPEELQQIYVMSDHHTATSDYLEISIMDGFYDKQLKVNTHDDPKEWWEVIDRTSGQVIQTHQWNYDKKSGFVKICEAKPWHDYTVNFLAYIIWDPVHHFNHRSNQWTTPAQMPYDMRHPKTREHVLDFLEKWLQSNSHVDVVRFTTFFYNFTLVFNEERQQKYVDWFGYSASVSPRAILEFEEEYGYRLCSEDFIDLGYHNSTFRVPSKRFLDWMDFQQRSVAKWIKECVDLCHEYGKEAMMFLGDHWIGSEPYGKYLSETGLDAVVGSVGSGATTRMISDIPCVNYTEGRFLPYFFPQDFSEGAEPEKVALQNWLQARRAILRSPLNRMGYGGYLGIAAKHDGFMTLVENLCNEFRNIHEKMQGCKAYTPTFKVAILNAWGKERSWMTNMVTHAKWYREIYSYVGVIESLSGMAIDIEFICFKDIEENGIDKEVGVIINAGEAGTSWSGGDNWINTDIVEKIRQWVHDGGGFIGIGEPTACHHGGRYFQLADVLGVDREIGYTLGHTKYDKVYEGQHFILEDKKRNMDFGESKKSVRQVGRNVKTLAIDQQDTLLAVNEFGKGRSVYMTGLPYSSENTRLLLRSIYWVASQETEMYKWYTSDIRTECAYYEATGYVAIINNANEEVNTILYKDKEESLHIHLEPNGIRWIAIQDIK